MNLKVFTLITTYVPIIVRTLYTPVDITPYSICYGYVFTLFLFVHEMFISRYFKDEISVFKHNIVPSKSQIVCNLQDFAFQGIVFYIFYTNDLLYASDDFFVNLYETIKLIELYALNYFFVWYLCVFHYFAHKTKLWGSSHHKHHTETYGTNMWSAVDMSMVEQFGPIIPATIVRYYWAITYGPENLVAHIYLHSALLVTHSINPYAFSFSHLLDWPFMTSIHHQLHHVRPAKYQNTLWELLVWPFTRRQQLLDDYNRIFKTNIKL